MGEKEPEKGSVSQDAQGGFLTRQFVGPLKKYFWHDAFNSRGAVDPVMLAIRWIYGAVFLVAIWGAVVIVFGIK